MRLIPQHTKARPTLEDPLPCHARSKACLSWRRLSSDDRNDNDNNDDHDDDNDDDDHLIDGDDDQKDGDYPARQTPPARLHGKSRVPTASAAKNKKPIRFTRPKKICSDRPSDHIDTL